MTAWWKLHVRQVRWAFVAATLAVGFLATVLMAAQRATASEGDSKVVMIILVVQGLIFGAVAVIYQRGDKQQDQFVKYVAEDQHAQGTTDAQMVVHAEAIKRFQARFDALPAELVASRHALKNELLPTITDIQTNLIEQLDKTEKRVTELVSAMEKRLTERLDRETREP